MKKTIGNISHTLNLIYIASSVQGKEERASWTLPPNPKREKTLNTAKNPKNRGNCPKEAKETIQPKQKTPGDTGCHHKTLREQPRLDVARQQPATRLSNQSKT